MRYQWGWPLGQESYFLSSPTPANKFSPKGEKSLIDLTSDQTLQLSFSQQLLAYFFPWCVRYEFRDLTYQTLKGIIPFSSASSWKAELTEARLWKQNTALSFNILVDLQQSSCRDSTLLLIVSHTYLTSKNVEFSLSSIPILICKTHFSKVAGIVPLWMHHSQTRKGYESKKNHILQWKKSHFLGVLRDTSFHNFLKYCINIKQTIKPNFMLNSSKQPKF